MILLAVTVISGLLYTGHQRLPQGSVRSLTLIFGHADAFKPLPWGGLLGCLMAVALGIASRRLSLSEMMTAWLDGLRTMMVAIVTLVLAWSLAAVTESLGTAAFLVSILSSRLAIEMLPASVFCLSALISFATGTAWGTMAILIPLVIPLTLNLGGSADPGQTAAYYVFLGTVASVMAGALFGDHSSLISDTTVMSAMASGCDHIDHVRSQLPDALTAALIAVDVGAVPAGFGVSPWVSLAVGFGVLLFVGRYGGRQVEAIAPPFVP